MPAYAGDGKISNDIDDLVDVMVDTSVLAMPCH
jgi:hypothetical protein